MMRTTVNPSVLQTPRDLAAAREQLILAYAPTVKYLAQRLASRLPHAVALDDLINAGVTGLEELDAWLTQVRGVALVSLELPGIGTPDGESLSFLDLVATDADQDPAQRVQAQQSTTLLAEAIDALPQQEKVVMALYYHEELTMKEIGQILNVTEARVSQIHTKAILHLRSKLTPLLAA
jgi:RNA polymerase sigma factor for flagellar operon FliA